MLSVIEDYVRDQYHREVVGVFEVGSMAMGLANKKSDMDVMVWVLPMWEDVVNGLEFSKHIQVDSINADVVIKDIRLVPRLLRKQNPSVMGLLNTCNYYVADEWEFVLADFWRMFDPRRCFISNTKLMESDYNRYTLGKIDYTLEKITSRLWYTYDLANVLKETKRYPYNWELPNDGKYLSVKNGDFTELYAMSGTKTKEEAVTYLGRKLMDVMTLDELENCQPDEASYGEFMKQFSQAFKNAMEKAPY